MINCDSAQGGSGCTSLYLLWTQQALSSCVPPTTVVKSYFLLTQNSEDSHKYLGQNLVLGTPPPRHILTFAAQCRGLLVTWGLRSLVCRSPGFDLGDCLLSWRMESFLSSIHASPLVNTPIFALSYFVHEERQTQTCQVHFLLLFPFFFSIFTTLPFAS